LADKIHPFRVTIISLAVYVVATALAFFFVRTAPMFAVAHVVCGTLSGFWITATSPLGSALFPKRRFTQFCSAMNIITALGMMIIGPACGWYIDHKPPVNGHPDYHYIYSWACITMICSLIVSLFVYRRFVELGGPKNYRAPE
jgi:MFS family permease